MTRTATAATPAPRNGRNGKVRTVKVDPAALATADLSAPISGLPAELAAALAAAQQAAAQRRTSAKKAPAARVSVAAHEAAALSAAGWKAPYVTASNQWKPQPRGRQNACKGDAAYGAALAILSQRPLSISELAALWIAAGNTPRPMAGVCQQISNRAQRALSQNAASLSLS